MSGADGAMVRAMKAPLQILAVTGALAAAAACGKKPDRPAEPSGSAELATPDAATTRPTNDAAAAADANAASPDAASAAPPDTTDPLLTVCPKVLEKLEECADDRALADALMAGANAKERKRIKALIGEIAEWPLAPCQNLAANYEFNGMLNHWDMLADPGILTSCGALGAAVAAAGGLFGGDQAF